MVSAEQRRRGPRRSPSVLLALSLLALPLLGGCGTDRTGGQVGHGHSLLLVSYAVTRSAYDRILPRFQAQWKARTGEDLEIKASYGGSGSQTRAVIEGLDADLVTLALAADVQKLEQAGLIQPGWQEELPLHAMVTNSVVAFIPRAGNPKGLRTWADLAHPGVQVITANPKTSGGARWNFLALWGSVSLTGGSDQAAEQFVTTVYRQVATLPKDAREASDIFLKRGQGDVLLNYENEAIQAGRSGELKTPFLVPPVNIRIEGPVAVVDRNVDRKGTRKAAEALARYLQSDDAQKIFAEEGFRPVAPAVWQQVKGRFAPVQKLFSVADLGGWEEVNDRFFGDNGLWNKILGHRR